MAVQVFTDSTSDIDASVKRALNIKTISLNISFGNDSMKEADVENKSFYKMMEERGIPTSSQPSVGELYDEMKKVIEAGDSLFCIFLSSGLSGTFGAAVMVKNMVLEKYEHAKIEIVDSLSTSMELGFAAIVAAKEANLGKTLEQVKAAALQIMKRSRFLFIPDSLEYLKKGGRIGGASALIGNLLKIIPILTVNNGKADILRKVRTKKNAVMTMVEKMLQDINEYGLGEIVVHHINCLSEAKELVNVIKEKLSVTPDILDIGPVIGMHVGPGAIGIVYYTQKDMR